tara:strand:- start:114 stop:671 length:558 start_codon:yes stop_codon:yes gene_type:complete
MKLKIERIKEKEFFGVWKPLYDELFEEEPEYDPGEYMNEDQKKKLKSLQVLRNHLDKIFLVAKIEDEVIGWCWGFQTTSDEFYMCNSGVVKQHQRKGIYSKLLDETVKILKDGGYYAIHSRHLAGNNAIIIPKLKFGFVITGLEVDVKYGLSVGLRYFLGQETKSVYDLRTGASGFDEKTISLFT